MTGEPNVLHVEVLSRECIAPKIQNLFFLFFPNSRDQIVFNFAEFFLKTTLFQKDCTVPKIDLYMPRNETVRPRPQILHSFICERFIYSQDRSAYLAAAK